MNSAINSTISSTVSASAGSIPREAGQRHSRWREAILGLLFVAPAAIITFVFGLFPVVSGFFISLQGGTILPEGFVGLVNYTEALGSLAYILLITVGLVMVVGGYLLFRGPYRLMQSGGGDFYPYLVAGIGAALATLMLVGLWFVGALSVSFAPLVLLVIAIVLYAVFEIRHRSGASYVVNSWGMMLLIFTALIFLLFTFSQMITTLTPSLAILSQVVSRSKYVTPLDSQVTALFGAVTAFVAAIVAHTIHRQLIHDHPDHPPKPGRVLLFGVLRWILGVLCVMFLLYIIGAIDMLRTTLSGLARVTPDALAALTDMKASDLAASVLVWPQVFTIMLGLWLIGLAFALWISATRRQSAPGTAAAFIMALLLMIGGWMFISTIPDAAASGDAQFYASLLRTVTYAVMTVPLQLGIGLLLAYLLFYEVTFGKSFYRIVFFMPYIAPVVATASVFAVIFSLDQQGLANQGLSFLGLPPQQWLRDQRGIFQIAAQLIGGRNTQLPPFLVGPPLPLVSAIIYAIWVFSGYNAVIFLAGLGGVPKELIEAAEVDGAGRWAAFRNIIFPLLSPTTFFLTLLAVVGTFKAFDSIYVLRVDQARGAMDTSTVYIFTTIQTGSRAYASALAFVLFGIILILTLVQQRVTRDQVFYG